MRSAPLRRLVVPVRGRPLDVEHDDGWREPGDARDCGPSSTAFEFLEEPRGPRIEPLGILDHLGRPLVRYVMPVVERFGFHTPHIQSEPDEMQCITTEAHLRMLQTEAGRMEDIEDDPEFYEEDAS